jgi:spore germination protein
LKASGGFSSAVAHAILTQENAQESFLRNVAALLRSGNWYGVNLDFEYVYPFDRGSYNQFLRRFADELHALGALLITALAPKTSTRRPGCCTPRTTRRARRRGGLSRTDDL